MYKLLSTTIPVLLYMVSSVKCDTITYYLGDSCTGEALSSQSDIGMACIPSPDNAQSFIIQPDDGYSYFRYTDSDCFDYEADIPFSGCIALTQGGGINKRPIAGDAQLDRIQQRIAVLNQTRIQMGFTSWTANRAANKKLAAIQKRDAEALDPRNPGDSVPINDESGAASGYALLEGDETGGVRQISSNEGATLADDVEAEYRADSSSIQGTFRNTNNQGTLTISLNQGTFSQFTQEFVGRIADAAIAFIMGGNESAMYNFDLGTLDDRSFTSIGSLIYQVGEGSGLKRIHSRMIVKTKLQ